MSTEPDISRIIENRQKGLQLPQTRKNVRQAMLGDDATTEEHVAIFEAMKPSHDNTKDSSVAEKEIANEVQPILNRFFWRKHLYHCQQ
ncbi:hypothetical protein T06_16350 [Trichinella sp. T6]|nr:hypothetical protein T06_16350 [Trichinella sp. T6]